MLSIDSALQVYILPTIRINNGQYRGKLSYTEVLRAICAGFTKNAEPKVCMRVSVDDSCRDGSLGQTTCALRCGQSLYQPVPGPYIMPWKISTFERPSVTVPSEVSGKCWLL